MAALRVHTDRLIVGVKPRVQASAGNGDVADLAEHGRPGEVALKLGAVAGFRKVGIVAEDAQGVLEGTGRRRGVCVLEVGRLGLDHARK